MKIAEINMFSYGSTGKIMMQIADCAREKEHEVYTFSPYDYSKKYKKMPPAQFNHMYYGTFRERWIHNLIGRILGCNGMLSIRGTYELINAMKKLDVDVIHLHNLHSYCINLPILFQFIKKSNKKVIWTLHDCWAFTGHCTHFEMIGCQKWKNRCEKCPQYREYPQSLIDNSRYMYWLKKRWFIGIENMTIVTPSKWLTDLVKQSFLKEYPVVTIHNGIDLSVFYPTPSDFKEKYNCETKKIILGVAADWGIKKGLDVFVELSKQLDNSYQIVLVGTNEKLDERLPENIISIHKTIDQKELASIYTAADLFLNPTREDTFPTVNIEALACGIPVITFDSGGSPESIDNKCGRVVEKDNISKMIQEIEEILLKNAVRITDCIDRAKEFDARNQFLKYVKLYEK